MKTLFGRAAALCLAVSLWLPFSAFAAFPDIPNRSVPNPEPALPAGFDAYNPPIDGSMPGQAAFAEWNRNGNPGDLVNLTGDKLGTFSVFGQTSGGNAVEKTPGTQYADSQRAQLLLNPELPANSMYLIWPLSNGQAGAPAAINRTEMWWVGPDTIPAGGQASAFGRNMSLGNLTPGVYIKPANGPGVWAQVTSYNGGKVDFNVPVLSSGSYQVWVHNGHGGHWGWSGPQTLNIQPATTYGSVFNVRNYGAAGNGSSDDSGAIQAAMNAAGAAGGVLYFPSGTYILNQTLAPPAHIQFKGDGKDASILRLGSGFNGLAMIFQDQAGQSSNLEFRDMTLDAAFHYNNTSIGCLVRLRHQSNVRFTNLKIISNDKQQFDLLATDHVSMQGCDFIGSGCYLGGGLQVFIDSCNWYGQYQDNAVSLCTIQSGGQLCMTNNTGKSYDESNPAAGRFIYLVGAAGSWGDIYLGNNTSHNMAPSPTKADQNAGEQILWEANNSSWTGHANGGSSNGISLPFGGTNYGGGAYSVVIEAGKGMGQCRRITADNGSGSLTLSQPWNVVPDSSSLAVILCLFDRAYCYGNHLEGRADYATRYTASTGFEAYSGAADLVFDSNTITNCRSGIGNFSIMDKAAGLQPTYWVTCMRNTISNCLWGVLTQYSQGQGASSQSACALLGCNYNTNIFSNIGGTVFPDTVYDSASGPGVIDLTVFQHNCGSGVAAGINAGAGVYHTADLGNSFNQGACAMPTPVPISNGGGNGGQGNPAGGLGGLLASSPTPAPIAVNAPVILSVNAAPNPVVGSTATLVFDTKNSLERVEVTVYSSAYSQVYHGTFALKAGPGYHSLSVPTAGWPRGYLHLRLTAVYQGQSSTKVGGLYKAG